MKRIIKTSVIFLFLLLTTNVYGQKIPGTESTLLPSKIVNAIIDEASGEKAYQHILETGGYNHNRFADEYEGTYYEAAYFLKKAKEYGFEDAAIEYFDSRDQWDGEVGELWEVYPNKRKICDYDDMTHFLASGSGNADVTAQIVYIGNGRPSQYDTTAVKGKIVLAEGRAGSIARSACARYGALGVVCYNTAITIDDPDQIAGGGIRGGSRDSKLFGFNLSYRMGLQLRGRLMRGDSVVVRAKVKTKYYPSKLNVVVATIKGSEKPDEEIVLCAHIFEGVTKQGANDNKSGGAGILETGRTLIQLIKDGVIERPKRTIRFLWVPEYSGTSAYLDAHPELVKNMLVNINQDMVGEHLFKNKACFQLMRTPYSRPSYLNDVMENYYEYVHDTNVQTLHLRSGSSMYVNAIVAPSGSKDPFFYKINPFYSASDHHVFNGWKYGVPGVMMIVWPDQWYHTSGDRPDKSDKTQMKRVAFIAAAASYTMANADEKMVTKMAAEILGRGKARVSYQFKRAMELVEHAEVKNINSNYKIAKNFISQGVELEKNTILSLLELSDGKSVNDYVKNLAANVKSSEKIYQSLLTAHAGLVSKNKNTKLKEPEFTKEEKEASKKIPVPTVKYLKNSNFSEWINNRDYRYLRYRLYRLGNSSMWELQCLIDGKKSILDIYNVLNAEYNRFANLKDIVTYINLLEKAGQVTFK